MATNMWSFSAVFALIFFLLVKFLVGANDLQMLSSIKQPFEKQGIPQ